MIVLHGGLQASEILGKIVPLLSNKRRVIAVDLQAHGRTADIDRPLSYDAMAQLGAGSAEMMKASPLYQTYARIAPKPADWPVLVTKMGELLRKDYDWSKEVAAIKAPTMLVFADADAIRPEHAVQFFQLLGGGKKDAGWDGSGMPHARLAILPRLTHYNILASPALAPTVAPFLDAPCREKCREPSEAV